MAKYQRRTETLRFTAIRPSDEQVQRRAERYLGTDFGWEIVAIGPIVPGRNRRRSTVFDVKVQYRREQS